MPKAKMRYPPESPKKCPRGHKHISWFMGEDHIFCWDCNKKHLLLECFGPSTVDNLPAGKEGPKEQTIRK
jgi:hypothetical protein